MANDAAFNDMIDFGTGAVPVDVTSINPDPGAYGVKILDMAKGTNTNSGKTSYRFTVVITEPGAFQGMTTNVNVGSDMSKDFNKSHLANCLLGMGLPIEKLAGQVKINPQLFIGRGAFIVVKEQTNNNSDDEDGNNNRSRVNKNFATKQMYEAAKRAAAIASGQSVPAAQTQAQQSSNPVPAGNPAANSGAAPAADLAAAFG